MFRLARVTDGHLRLGLRHLSGLLLALLLASGSGCPEARAAPAQGPTLEASTVDGGVDLSIRGQIGGLSGGLAVEGDYAYVGEGLRVVVFDISRPSSPQIIGHSPIFSSAVSAIQVRAGLAYVAAGPAGLQVVDVSTPRSPRLVGSLAVAGSSMDVTVDGSLAFVVQHLSEVQGLSGSRSMWSLVVVDVTAPASPQVIGSFPLAAGAKKLVASGGMVYVADNFWFGQREAFNGLTVVDVSDPSAPRLAGSVKMDESSDLEVIEHVAYSVGSLKMTIVDLSSPASPRVLSSLTLPGLANGIDLQGGLAYIADGSTGLLVIDISAPKAPHVVGRAKVDGAASDVVVAGTLAFVFDDVRGLSVFDVATLSAPNLLSAVNLAGRVYAVQVVDKVAYVASGSAGLQVIDVTAPEEPRLIGRADVGNATNLQVIGNLAYVVGWDDKLWIVDVTSPRSPHLIGGVTGLSSAFAVDVVGDMAYVADLAQGMKVVDVSMPTTPRLIGGFDTENGAFDVEVSGDLAYLATQSGLQVLDITEPHTPRAVGWFAVPSVDGFASTVRVVGTLAYLGMGRAEPFAVATQGSLAVVDIAVPSSPQLVGLLDLSSGYPRDIDVADELVYLVNGDGGLQVIDARVPSVLRWIGSVATASPAWDLDLNDGLAYVAGDMGGLLLIGPRNRPTGAGHVAWLPFLSATQALR